MNYFHCKLIKWNVGIAFSLFYFIISFIVRCCCSSLCVRTTSKTDGIHEIVCRTQQQFLLSLWRTQQVCLQSEYSSIFEFYVIVCIYAHIRNSNAEWYMFIYQSFCIIFFFAKGIKVKLKRKGKFFYRKNGTDWHRFHSFIRFPFMNIEIFYSNIPLQSVTTHNIYSCSRVLLVSITTLAYHILFTIMNFIILCKPFICVWPSEKSMGSSKQKDEKRSSRFSLPALDTFFRIL